MSNNLVKPKLVNVTLDALRAAIDAAESQGMVVWNVDIHMRDDDELRGQYELTMFITDPSKRESWREVAAEAVADMRQ